MHEPGIRAGMGRYLWDHRNESLRAFLIDTVIGGPDAMGNKDIDGLFLDDFWYCPLRTLTGVTDIFIS